MKTNNALTDTMNTISKIDSMWAKSREIREQIEEVCWEDGATDDLGNPIGEYAKLQTEFNAVCDEADAMVAAL